MTDPWARPNQPAPPPQQPQGAPPQAPPPPQFQQPHDAPASEQDSSRGRVKDFFRDPLSIVLVVVIVVALVVAGVLAAELYARHRADSVVGQTVSCVVQDDVKVSFGVMPPFLIQHMSGHYTNIHVETAGNQIREAKGMKVNISINDVRLQDTADSSGSVGSLVADVNWSSDGIRQTIADSIPIVGAFVTGVSTNPSEGTIELQGALGAIKAKPVLVNNGISLQVTELTGLGFTLPKEAVQPALDAFTGQLIQSFPMGIHANSVRVTDSGVESQFSTQNAAIPKSQGAQADPCFAAL